MIANEVEKYLSKYASPHWKLEKNECEEINTAVVVPAICEYDNIRRLIDSLLKNDNEDFNNVLVIFCINNLQSSSHEVKEDNYKSLQFLRSIISNNSNDSFAEQIISSGMNIAVVDAAADGFEMPEREGGVGLARKIGMDLALKVFNHSSPDKKILVCLDADCTVQNNYLHEIKKNFRERNLSAAVLSFEHKFEYESEEAQRAIICYEIFLRYYVEGLKFAGSPYSFHTIGSSMVCDVQCYLKTEGMNKRKAAEDFYFLEKLAKNFTVESINSTTVYPSPRASWRVPFGTGQRVNRFFSHTRNEYLIYDPECFIILKRWLEIFYHSSDETGAQFLKYAENIHAELNNFLQQNNFENDWEKIRSNSKSLQQIDKQKLRWFDGFKTLKLIHHLRDTAFPEINMFTALDNFFHLNGVDANILRDEDIPGIETQIKYLTFLRKLNKHYDH